MSASQQTPKTRNTSLPVRQRSACNRTKGDTNGQPASVCSTEPWNVGSSLSSLSSCGCSQLHLSHRCLREKRLSAVLPARWFLFLIPITYLSGRPHRIMQQQYNCAAVNNCLVGHQRLDEHGVPKKISIASLSLPSLGGASGSAVPPTQAETREDSASGGTVRETTHNSNNSDSSVGPARQDRSPHTDIACESAADEDEASLSLMQEAPTRVLYTMPPLLQGKEEKRTGVGQKMEDDESKQEADSRQDDHAADEEEKQIQVHSTEEDERESTTLWQRIVGTVHALLSKGGEFFRKLMFWKKDPPTEDETEEDKQYLEVESFGEQERGTSSQPSDADTDDGEDEAKVMPLKLEDNFSPATAAVSKRVPTYSGRTGSAEPPARVSTEPSTRVFPDVDRHDAFNLRRRLAVVPSVQATTSAQGLQDPYRQSTEDGETQDHQSMLAKQQGHAQNVTVEDQETFADDWGDNRGEVTAVDVSRRRGYARRRRNREHARGSPVGPSAGVTDKLSGSVVITNADGIKKVNPPDIDDAVGQQQPRSGSTWLPQQSTLARTESSEAEGREGSGTSTNNSTSRRMGNLVQGTPRNSMDGTVISIGWSGTHRGRGGPLWGSHNGRASRSPRQTGALTEGANATPTWGGHAPGVGGQASSLPHHDQASRGVLRSVSTETTTVPNAWLVASSSEGNWSVSGQAPNGVSSAVSVPPATQLEQQLELLNSFLRTTMEAKANLLNDRRRSETPAVVLVPTLSGDSVIGPGVQGNGATEPSMATSGLPYIANQVTWQEHERQRQQVQNTVGNGGLPFLVAEERDQENFILPRGWNHESEEGVWPSTAEDAQEETRNVEELLRNPHLVKPLRGRQRVVLLIAVVLSLCSALLLSRTAARLMDTYDLSMRSHYFLLGGLGVMILGQSIFNDLKLAGTAAQLLVQDIFLRRKRQKIIGVAEALQTLREQEQRSERRRKGASEAVYAEDIAQEENPFG